MDFELAHKCNYQQSDSSVILREYMYCLKNKHNSFLISSEVLLIIGRKKLKSSKGKFSEETLPAYVTIGKLYFTEKRSTETCFISM